MFHQLPQWFFPTQALIVSSLGLWSIAWASRDDLGVCTENLIRVDAVMESPKLAE
jgi:hypothetical protein